MRSTTRVIWSLVASLAHLSANVNHAMVHAAGDVLEVDLLFPRDNQTYAPTSYMPIVFALQKAELARHIYPVIEFRVRNLSDPGEGQGRTYHQALDFPNGTISDSEPWLVHTLVDNFAAAGTWTVVWDLWWESCRWEEGFDGQPLFAGRVQGNVSTGVPGAISFHTTDGGQALDLVAATADEKACHAAGEPDVCHGLRVRGLGTEFAIVQRQDQLHRRGSHLCLGEGQAVPGKEPANRLSF